MIAAVHYQSVIILSMYHSLDVAYLVKLILRLLGVIHSRLVTIVPKMSRSDQSITTIIARSYGDQNAIAFLWRLEFEKCL